eukprot:3062301-Prymnesium_polylepis.1
MGVSRARWREKEDGGPLRERAMERAMRVVGGIGMRVKRERVFTPGMCMHHADTWLVRRSQAIVCYTRTQAYALMGLCFTACCVSQRALHAGCFGSTD